MKNIEVRSQVILRSQLRDLLAALAHAYAEKPDAVDALAAVALAYELCLPTAQVDYGDFWGVALLPDLTGG